MNKVINKTKWLRRILNSFKYRRDLIDYNFPMYRKIFDIISKIKTEVDFSMRYPESISLAMMVKQTDFVEGDIAAVGIYQGGSAKLICELKKDYITHPEAVAKLVGEDLELKIVAWLHDVIEDTELTLQDLSDKGIPQNLVDAINCLSRRPLEDYKDYILQVKENEIATKVKLADLKHNLSDLKNGSMRDKYLLAFYILRNDK